MPRVVPPRWSLGSFDEERLAECLVAKACKNEVTPGAIRSVPEIDDLRRISDSCTKRVGLRAKTRKRPKYWWTDEIGELRKESCPARRRFIGRTKLLIKQGGSYEDVVNEDASLKAEWRASRVWVRRAIWSYKEAYWKELLSELDLDP